MPPPRRSSLRAGALLSAGALSLHELRYLVGWGGGAGRALADQGHAYLGYVMPLAVGLAAAGLAQILLRLGHTRTRTRPDRTPSRLGAWLLASAALLLIYVAQETVEGLLEPGHPGGVAGVLGHGGLVAAPLALAIGGLIALADGQARAVLAAPSRLGPAAPPAVAPPPGRPHLPTLLRPGTSAGELALHLCGRAPPPALP